MNIDVGYFVDLEVERRGIFFGICIFIVNYEVALLVIIKSGGKGREYRRFEVEIIEFVVY